MTVNPAALAAAARGDILNALIASTPGGIERQEAAGQTALCANANLPKDMGNVTREEVTKHTGIVFGADDDDIFVSATLPVGWRKEATGHSMHNDLLDDKGRKRASIFYKAAFYDRRADMNFRRFYRVENIYPKHPTNDSDLPVVVKDGTGTVIHEVGSAKYSDYDTGRKLLDEGAKWLDANYPEHKSVWAYW